MRSLDEESDFKPCLTKHVLRCFSFGLIRPLNRQDENKPPPPHRFGFLISVDKSQFSRFTPLPTQQHSFFRNKPFIHLSCKKKKQFVEIILSAWRHNFSLNCKNYSLYQRIIISFEKKRNYKFHFYGRFSQCYLNEDNQLF